MTEKSAKEKTFVSAAEDAAACRRQLMDHPSYRLAYDDADFMLREELRAVRLQMEWLKPDLIQDEHGIKSTVVIFGGARFPERPTAEQKFKAAEAAFLAAPEDVQLQQQVRRARHVLDNSRYYDEARRLASRVTEYSLSQGGSEFVVVTGGGPGVMEAANRGAAEVGGKTIGLNIVLPFEQEPNRYITPELCFQFHYFALRKMHFLKRARALVACPGGFGTLDELFETLTLIQTGKVKAIPVVLLGKEYWTRLIDFNYLLEQGAIAQKDLDLFSIVDTAQEAWQILHEAW